MKVDQVKNKIEKLRSEVKKHNDLYYKKSQSEISDFEFDRMLKNLEELEEQYPQFKESASPTDFVGSDISSDSSIITLNTPMYSLDKAFSMEEVENFFSKVKEKETGNMPFTCELKLDGFSVNLYYDNGELIYATTRGDGIVGEDITENIKTIPSIPLKINHKTPIEVRGEIILNIDEFDRINKERESNGEKVFANPRNAAAGSIKLKDPARVKARKLDYKIYSVGLFEESSVDSQYKLLEYLRNLGFKIVEHYYSDNVADLIEQCKIWDKGRDDLNYMVDGLVFKVSHFSIQDKIGHTSKFPKWAVAYKFKAKEAETKLLSVDFQVGRTGAVTPVAKLNPVYLAGTTVSRATLHNANEIKRLGLKEGDYVRLIKSGEIVPKIIGVNLDRRSENAKSIIFPESCPVCSTQLISLDNGSKSYCDNLNCPAQILRRIEHFASRDTVGIRGLGESVIQQLLDNNMIEKIEDIYSIDYEKFASLPHQGKRSAEKLQKAVEVSKTQKLGKLIAGLGIRFVGLNTAKILTDSYSDIDSLMKATSADLFAIDKIGEKTADAVVEFFSNKENILMIKSLKKSGVVFNKIESKMSGKLTGMSFVVTGKIENYTRKELNDLIEDNGGKVSSTVSSKLDYLLAGENAGSKLEKARKFNTIKIISGQDFFDKIR